MTLCAIFTLLCGCGKEEKKTAKQTEPEKPVVEEEEEKEPEPLVNPHKGQKRSLLTGLWVKKSVARKRPIAFMLGNTAEAAPQSGIGKASVIYEIPVEGGITRLMAIIENYKKVDKIGSSRSCRYYFVHYAMEYDAIYCHFGQSKYALPVLRKDSVNNINGLENLAGKAYYRSRERKAPHNAYAVGEKLYSFAKNKGYRLNYTKKAKSHFRFAKKKNSLRKGKKAVTIKPGYRIDQPVFKYNRKKKEYYRSQYGKPHVDQETGKQLHCKNVIMQFVDIGLFDDKKSLVIDTVGSGTGIFATRGRYIPIRWKKDSEFGVTRYFDGNGKEIRLNRGKTWVLIVDRSKMSQVSIQ